MLTLSQISLSENDKSGHWTNELDKHKQIDPLMHVNMFALHNQLKKIDLSSDYDSKYIGCLLDFLFTQAELGVSSFSGKCSNFNGLSHSPLDPDKMDFIKGMYSDV